MDGNLNLWHLVFQLGLSPLYMVAIGDSKTVGFFCCDTTRGYLPMLEANLRAALPTRDPFFLKSLAQGGWMTSNVRAEIDAYLASMVEVEKVPEFVLINLGSNDVFYVHYGPLTYETWSADMGYIMDAVHAKWPDARVLLARPFSTGAEFGAAFDLYDDTWIPAVIAPRSDWAGLGPDERAYLVPYLADVTHPTAEGYQLTADEWQTAMGY